MARRSPQAQREWLATGWEEPLEADLPIVDPHHHLWDHIDPPYLLDDLLADAGAGHRVEATVFVECGWGWDRAAADPVMIPVPEVARVAALADESVAWGGAVIGAIVGHADLRHGPAAGRALDALAEAGGRRFVGIRHATAWDADPAIPNHRTDPAPGLMGSDAFRAGFAELARRGLSYDAWNYHPQLPEIASLARAFPDTTIVVDHIGGPLGVRSYAGRREEVRAAARAAFTDLATLSNVVVKLGGIGMTIMGGDFHRGDRPPTSAQLADHWGPDIAWLIDTFGVDRAMFESNFPVDSETCSYVVLWNTFKRIAAAAGASPADKAALFAGTARRTYRIAP